MMATRTMVFWPVAIWRPRVGAPGRPGDGEAQGMLVEVGARRGSLVRVVGRLYPFEEWVAVDEVQVVLVRRQWVHVLGPDLALRLVRRVGPQG